MMNDEQYEEGDRGITELSRRLRMFIPIEIIIAGIIKSLSIRITSKTLPLQKVLFGHWIPELYHEFPDFCYIAMFSGDLCEDQRGFAGFRLSNILKEKMWGVSLRQGFRETRESNSLVTHIEKFSSKITTL